MAGLDDLTRLGADAMGPCSVCGRQLLETGVPIFYRVTVAQCGIDTAQVRQHVGLAMAMGGGPGGLALASVMGPECKPVLVLSDGRTVNVCTGCQNRPGYLMLAEFALNGGDHD